MLTGLMVRTRFETVDPGFGARRRSTIPGVNTLHIPDVVTCLNIKHPAMNRMLSPPCHVRIRTSHDSNLTALIPDLR